MSEEKVEGTLPDVQIPLAEKEKYQSKFLELLDKIIEKPSESPNVDILTIIVYDGNISIYPGLYDPSGKMSKDLHPSKNG